MAGAGLTPAASPSAACTVAAQEAQLIPSMGRTMRALLMELVRRRRGPPIGGGGLPDEEALQHVHAPAEAEIAPPFLCELHGRGLKRRQRGIDPQEAGGIPLPPPGGRDNPPKPHTPPPTKFSLFPLHAALPFSKGAGGGRGGPADGGGGAPRGGAPSAFSCRSGSEIRPPLLV